jgi:hypothetical protein
LQKNPDGSVDIYFGPEAPAGKESNWIPTNADGATGYGEGELTNKKEKDNGYTSKINHDTRVGIGYRR